jgi:hypothetical protein
MTMFGFSKEPQPAVQYNGFGGLIDGGAALLDAPTRNHLTAALKANAFEDKALLMDSLDTTFAGTADDVTDEEVINAIRSVPTHY